MDIRVAITDMEINACFPVIRELRPHLSADQFTAQVQRQMKNHNYVLVYLTANNEVAAVAGYRIAEFLAWGKAFYVDDLATLTTARKHGYGGKLLDWLMEKAKELSCNQFHLDSGVHRHDAHRLYLNKKMHISSYHFVKDFSQP